MGSWERAEQALSLFTGLITASLARMALNPHAKPFIFKPAGEAVPFGDGFGASPTGPLSSDQTLYATNAKLERLRLAGRPALGPDLLESPPKVTSGARGDLLASEPPDTEELTFDEIFDHGAAEGGPGFSQHRAEVCLNMQLQQE